ncbi:MAG: ribose 5-phosphate isomerase B [Myxococcota bacterium]|nr:ribose 5-phosphate isomerase B [Myxococcota bacterium]
MRLIIGSDHAGLELKNKLLEHLGGMSYEVKDVGTHTSESTDYPDYAAQVASAVSAGEADLGVLVCGTGQGMAITANKVAGVRAAVCADTFTAHSTREHNDANVLCLGDRVVGSGLACEIVDAFLSAEFEGGRHARRIGKITALEQGEQK